MPADIPRRFNGSRNSASVISGFASTLQNRLRMCFDALRFAVAAPAFRNDVANFPKVTAPANRAGRADAKTLGGLPTGQTTLNATTVLCEDRREAL
ncbi:hypothetical protein [Bradyrhizobium brasilense]|uniref:hypothetical protein n=1 Tax=Bradyrhizobium brasilense TaxID=1419277 RepID=UPI0011781768|nr:hypothetical protein [Bradyrhizobium brasilense]